jgi:hypothetical protein
MVRIEQVGYDDFVSVRADDPADRTSQLLEGTRAPRAIIRYDVGGQLYFYVRPVQQVIDRCRGRARQTVKQALELHEDQRDPLVDADADAETSPDVCVIQRDGELVGYYDVTMPVNTVRSGLSSERGPFAAEAARPQEARSVRHVHADFPDAVPEGEAVSLLVSLRQTSGGGTEVPVVTSGGVIDVIIRPRKGFTSVGRGEHELRVTDAASSLPVQFKLRATAVGPGRIEVFCLQGGTPLGSVTVYATVLPPGPSADMTRSVEVTQPLAPPPATEADLMLLIRDWQGQQGRCLEYTLKAADPTVGLNFKRYYSKPFQVDPQAYFRQFYALLDQRLQEAGEADAAAQLDAYGDSLFDDLIPEDVQVLLWELRHRIKTVQVLSEEAWVPWELVKLTAQDAQGRWTDGPFLCQAFRLTRWFPEVARRPRLRLRNVAVVAPDGTGLPNAGPEKAYLLGLAVPGRRAVTAVLTAKEQLLAELQKGEHDGWHFVGHGSSDQQVPDESLLDLGGGRYLRVNDLSGRVVRNCVRSEPLVFLNACQSGHGAAGLTGVGGWAAKFVKAGAAAFVGTLWSVRDGSAKAFATAFYDRLLAGMTVADAAFEARQAAGTTGLAYTVFADPFATVATD